MESIGLKKLSVARTLWAWLLTMTRQVNKDEDYSLNNKVWADSDCERIYADDTNVVGGMISLFNAIFTHSLIQTCPAPFSSLTGFSPISECAIINPIIKGYDVSVEEAFNKKISSLSPEDIWSLICENVSGESIFALGDSKVLVFKDSGDAWGVVYYLARLERFYYKSRVEGCTSYMGIRSTSVFEVKYNYKHDLHSVEAVEAVINSLPENAMIVSLKSKIL